MFFSTNKEVANAVTLHEVFISVTEIFCSDQIANPVCSLLPEGAAHSQDMDSVAPQSPSTPA